LAGLGGCGLGGCGLPTPCGQFGGYGGYPFGGLAGCGAPAACGFGDLGVLGAALPALPCAEASAFPFAGLGLGAGLGAGFGLGAPAGLGLAGSCFGGIAPLAMPFGAYDNLGLGNALLNPFGLGAALPPAATLPAATLPPAVAAAAPALTGNFGPAFNPFGVAPQFNVLPPNFANAFPQNFVPQSPFFGYGGLPITGLTGLGKHILIILKIYN